MAAHVESYAEKWDAERAAQRVHGVKALGIEINVALPGSSQRNDVDIARSTESVLRWMTHLPKDSVKLKPENGWVTLTGEVELGIPKTGRRKLSALPYGRDGYQRPNDDQTQGVLERGQMGHRGGVVATRAH